MTLFLPGPVHVNQEIREACARPMVGHRSSEYSEVHRTVIDALKTLLHTDQNVYLSTSSATGVMEAAMRNLVEERVLSCVCGAFSNRWNNIAKANGKQSDQLETEWGMPTRPGALRKQLQSGEYDAVTVTHNETSTGLLNPLPEIAEVMEEFPDVLFLVDATSSMAATNIKVDEWNIDMVLASVQKAFAVPPGLSLFALSDRALERSQSVQNRGYYFDFQRYESYQQKDQTISTGPIPQIYALRKRLQQIGEEGIQSRFKRHELMAERCRTWARKHEFSCFPEEGFESPTLTCIENSREIPIEKLRTRLQEKGYVISNGYGDISQKTFRIGHMGDHTIGMLNDLLETIAHILPEV